MRTLSLLLATATLCSAAVTPPDQIKVPAGFKVELLREAGPREGSWICMAIDDAGRLYISSQDKTPESGFTKDSTWGGMWRATMGAEGGENTKHKSQITKWERVNVPVGDAMGMLWAFDSLYVSGNGPEGRGIYRCKDTHGDGNLDSAVLFKAIPEGSGEHGAHAIILGPDKKLYIVNGNTTPILDGLSPDSPYRNWGEDDLLPRVNDPIATFFDKIKAPYGCVYRTDENGTKWELFAGGFRNPYDIAFNADGELFTYDSDMEWDRGLPWYRPTRLIHVVPGGEYGFREGSAKWPPWYPDSLPAVCDIGVGCPTGMKFGTGARGWPEQYQRALFFIDWTYGRILAVRMHEKGASYTARNDIKSYTYPKEAEANGDVEVFLSGKGMPITDMEFGKDGALYFTTGGRGTSAALYRVSWDEKAAKSQGASPGKGGASGRVGFQPAAPGILPGAPDVARSPHQDTPAPANPADAHRANERKTTPDGPGRIPGPAGETPALPARPPRADADAPRGIAPAADAPEAQQKLAGGAASKARVEAVKAPNPTLSEIRAKDSALPTDAFGLGVGQIFKRLTRRLVFENAEPPQMNRQVVSELKRDLFHYSGAAKNLDRWALENRDRDLRIIEKRLRKDGTYTPELAEKEFAQSEGGAFRRVRDAAEQLADWISVADQNSFDALVQILTDGDFRIFSRGLLTAALSLARVGEPAHQETVLNVSKKLADLKTRPSKTQPVKLPDDLQLLKLRVLELSFARQGRPSEERVKSLVEELLQQYPAKGPEAAKLNRELSQLLIWLTNPELGELNSELAAKAAAPGGEPKTPAPAPTPAGGKSGGVRLDSDRAGKVGSLSTAHEGASRFLAEAQRAPVRRSTALQAVRPAAIRAAESSDTEPPAQIAGGRTGCKPVLHTAVRGLQEPDAGVGGPHTQVAAHSASLAVVDATPDPAAPNSEKAIPTSAPPIKHLGPVPNPGASVFPGRKGDDALAAAGREVIEKTLDLMDKAESQEEQIWYALCLRWAHGWTPEQRARYFRWFHEKAGGYAGGNSFSGFLNKIRTEALARCTEAERAALGHLASAPTTKALVDIKPRAFVQAWTMADLEPSLGDVGKGRNFARGRELFGQAQCILCHKMGVTGGNVGPDLTAVASRFPRKDILTAILDPNKDVSDQYAMMTFTVRRGEKLQEVSGLVQEDTGGTFTVLTEPLTGKTEAFYHHVVVKKEKALVSIMLPGLLNTLTKEEVLDLLAYLDAGGKAEAANFK